MNRPSDPVARKAARLLSRALLGPALLGIAGTALADATPPAASERQLEQRLEDLAEQLKALQAELARLKAERVTPPAATVAASAPAVAPTSGEKSASPFDKLTLWGYGEAYLTHPTHVSGDSQARAPSPNWSVFECTISSRPLPSPTWRRSATVAATSSENLRPAS